MRKQPTIQIMNLTADDMYSITSGQELRAKTIWRLGSNNLLPEAIAILNRKSPIHRGILNSKRTYISGQGFVVDKRNTQLNDFRKKCNTDGEDLRTMLRKVIFDKLGWGNGYIELVKDAKGKWLSLYHQDTMKCRLAKDKKAIWLYHDWDSYKDTDEDKVKKIAIYPEFSDEQNTGYLHSIIHIKDYEPGFENYGVIDWIAGLNVSGIAYKTNKWNISRLDNSFAVSGLLIVDGQFKDDIEAEAFVNDVKNKFTGEGNQGQLLTVAKEKSDGAENGSKFIPIETKNEGDWKGLQEQAATELIVAHNWYRSLTSLPDNNGFDTKRIISEYNIALNTVILDEQQIYLNILKTVINNELRYDVSELAFINRPPITDKPIYMKVWEARKADGLDYDENDPGQQIYLSNINKATQITVQ
jgi:hypothetical protein